MSLEDTLYVSRKPMSEFPPKGTVCRAGFEQLMLVSDKWIIERPSWATHGVLSFDRLVGQILPPT